jgi:hypothetical protein
LARTLTPAQQAPVTNPAHGDQEAIDLVKPGFIEFGEDGLGSLGFIVVTGELDCRDADRLAAPRRARPAPPSVPSEPARMPRKN